MRNGDTAVFSTACHKGRLAASCCVAGWLNMASPSSPAAHWPHPLHCHPAGDGSLVKTPIGADAASILDTVNHLNATWGSAEKYCQVRLGLSDAELTSIRTNLMKKP